MGMIPESLFQEEVFYFIYQQISGRGNNKDRPEKKRRQEINSFQFFQFRILRSLSTGRYSLWVSFFATRFAPSPMRHAISLGAFGGLLSSPYLPISLSPHLYFLNLPSAFCDLDSVISSKYISLSPHFPCSPSFSWSPRLPIPSSFCFSCAMRYAFCSMRSGLTGQTFF